MAARRAAVAPTSEELKPLPSESHDIISDLSPNIQVSGGSTNKMESLSIDQIYHSQRKEDKTNHWRNNPYSAGLVDITWRDELRSDRIDGDDGDEANGPNRSCCADVASEEMDPTCGCLTISGIVCGRLDAGRIGNMAVLREKNVMVEEPDLDCEVGEGDLMPTKLVSKRVPDLIVGPYWPMLMFVTYPLILGVSLATAIKAIFVPNQNKALIISWCILTFGLCYALFSVGFRDPGILPKYKTAPKSNGTGRWRWNDRAQTFKPPLSMYDPDCAVVIEEFDHTCPWTGTGIGKKNMPAFQSFIGLLFTCLIMDIILLTTSSISIR